MEFSSPDVLVFLAFVVCVISVGLIKSRNEKSSEDYFLAGRGSIGLFTVTNQESAGQVFFLR